MDERTSSNFQHAEACLCFLQIFMYKKLMLIDV